MTNIDEKISNDRLKLLQTYDKDVIINNSEIQNLSEFLDTVYHDNYENKDPNLSYSMFIHKLLQKFVQSNTLPLSHLNYVDDQVQLQTIQCSNCKQPVKHHIQLIPCDHTLCQDCCKALEETNLECCCTCGKSISSISKLKKLDQIVANLVAKCPFECEWRGRAKDVESHLKECKNNNEIIEKEVFTETQKPDLKLENTPKSNLEHFFQFQKTADLSSQKQYLTQLNFYLKSDSATFQIKESLFEIIEARPHNYFVYIFDISCEYLSFQTKHRFNDFRKLQHQVQTEQLPGPNRWWYFGGSSLQYAEFRKEELEKWLEKLLKNVNLRKRECVVDFLTNYAFVQ